MKANRVDTGASVKPLTLHVCDQYGGLHTEHADHPSVCRCDGDAKVEVEYIAVSVCKDVEAQRDEYRRRSNEAQDVINAKIRECSRLGAELNRKAERIVSIAAERDQYKKLLEEIETSGSGSNTVASHRQRVRTDLSRALGLAQSMEQGVQRHLDGGEVRIEGVREGLTEIVGLIEASRAALDPPTDTEGNG